MSLRVLTALEARVLAVLVEKQFTVPDSYPLSLNALTMGCNQKTSRDPVMNAGENEVLRALDELRGMSLVNRVSGSRVERYEHNFRRGINVPGQAEALLTLLMLRGPQTAAELRSNTERLHRFADISSVEAFLAELAERQPPLAVKLARAPGARESRWAHLLCGEVLDAAPAAAAGDPASRDDEILQLRAEQARQAAEIEGLKAQLAQIKAELGLA
ncbi:YceH family protein [Pelomonas sp. V22]|uniref:YceH family protein n=1 Tax=Pelomonas sp. V22 TaxID=2822139 RepID=UPI0024A7DD90|nr:YceH family protein [Pelomonas sp. V22]MDI4632006.1 YceH family protein [Pelomonas sp. V22]